MSHSPVRRRHNRLIGLLSVVAVAAAMLVTAPIAEAGKPASTPAATITIDPVRTTAVPTASDGTESAGIAGASFVVHDAPFDVHFTTDYPLSTSKTTTVVLTVTTGPDQGTLALTTDVAPGLKEGTITGAVLPTKANNVTLKVAVDARKTDVTPGTISVDVLKTWVSADQTSALTGIGGGGGAGAACDPTPADPICGDLILPSGNTVDTGLLLAQGCAKDDCSTPASYLQVLFGIDPTTDPNATRANPFILIAKCDKSLCAGKGIKSYKLSVSLNAGATPTPSYACADKGVVDQKVEYCTDYVQSTRDGAGDVLLYLLFIRDAKIIFG